jgi:hypothetical protein
VSRVAEPIIANLGTESKVAGIKMFMCERSEIRQDLPLEGIRLARDQRHLVVPELHRRRYELDV